MRRLYTAAGLVALVVATVAVTVLVMQMNATPPTAKAAEPAEAKKERWEYARLNYNRFGEDTPECEWVGPDGKSVSASTWGKVCAKMKLEISTDSSLALLNHFGQDGWELAQYVISCSGQRYETAHILKRRTK